MKTTLKKNAITLAITIAAAGSIFAVTAYNGSKIAQAAQVTPAQNNEVVIDKSFQVKGVVPQALSQVGVQLTQAANYRAQIVGYGEARPRYELGFTSEVTGRVEWLSGDFEAGATVKKGDLLARLDPTAYKQAVTQAKSDVATATQELLEEQRQGEQARSEWQRSGLQGAPNSPLVLREPQLASAQAKLANAQQALVKANEDLANTEIRAPFDSVVVSRDIQPGSYLSTGSNVATLYSTDRFEIKIPLSEQQWTNLPEQSTEEEWSATLTNSTGDMEWQAKVERNYQFVAQETRQRSIVLVVEGPLEQEHPLFPGTFVTATIAGSEIDGLWQLPSSALSQQGEIWTVDAQGVLAKAAASTVFEYQQHIYIEPVQPGDSVKVVMRPLSNFKVGMKVAPTLIEENNDAQPAEYLAEKSAASTESGEG